MEISLEERKKVINRVTWIGVVTNVFLAVIKIIGGYISNSQALIADGIHSFSDLISDGIVLLAAKHAHEEADEEHPYGHGRFETLATIGVGIFLIIVGIGIAIDAYSNLTDDNSLVIPGVLALSVAFISIIANEGLYQITARAGRRINSKMLIANAWHSRTDSISSIVVLIGIGGAMMGWSELDSIAAIIVAFMIIKIGWELSHHSLKELVDTAIEPEKVEAIKQKIMNVDGVEALHMLRTRSMGHQALVDVHIIVDSDISVSEGHRISDAVAVTLRSSFDYINDVTVHIDPEDDEHTSSSKHLPLRTEVLAELDKHWHEIKTSHQLECIRLHYLDGMINVEAHIPLSRLDSIDQAQQMKQKLQSSVSHIEYIRQVEVLFK